MEGKIRPYDVLQAPYIKIKTKVTIPGKTNGKPNIRDEYKYVVAPSGKKIATYIKNQIFGSDLVTQTEGLDINWLMPTLSEALEEAVYSKEAFIYLHKFDNKVYLECLKKCDIHNLVQKYDKIISCDIIQDYETDENDYVLERHIEIKDGSSTIQLKALEKTKNSKEYIPMSIAKFNKITGASYKNVYNLPYEVIINIDIGQEFFKDSEKLLHEEMIIFNTLAEEIEKTKTRIVTSQHYQTGDIVSSWQPRSNMYEVKTIEVNNLQDYFTIVPGDEEHQMFEFLQGNIRIDEYVSSFKFCDYQIIQMAGLSPMSFGYEKDAYQNKDTVDLNANASDMTIEAIKKQIEPQINKLIENVIKLQRSQNIQINTIPEDLVWDYGSNERFDDQKKLKMLGSIQRTTAVPYGIRAKIVAPILNKLIDEDIDESIVNEYYEKEREDLRIEYEEV